MAKPICLIKLDMRGNEHEDIYAFNNAFQERMPDYHVFCIPKIDFEENVDQMEFSVFYEKDFTEIQYVELRKLIEDSIKPTTV